jgi:hypothetical protein
LNFTSFCRLLARHADAARASPGGGLTRGICRIRLAKTDPSLYRNAATQASPATLEFDKTQYNQYHAFYVAVQHR